MKREIVDKTGIIAVLSCHGLKVTHIHTQCQEVLIKRNYYLLHVAAVNLCKLPSYYTTDYLVVSLVYMFYTAVVSHGHS